MLLSINIFVAKATGKKVKTDLLRLLMSRILTGGGVHSRNMEAKLNYTAKNNVLSFVIVVFSLYTWTTDQESELPNLIHKTGFRRAWSLTPGQRSI